MDGGSVVSEPISDAHRAFAKKKSASMTILTPKGSNSTKYSLLQDNSNTKSYTNLDITPLSTSVPHSAATTGRRRKGSSLTGHTLSSRSTRAIESKELRSALQDRETVIQNLRIQLCLGKLPRPSGPPLNEADKPMAEQKLQKLKTEADNKKIKIKNLKLALEKLDITDNIDVRIRQAELEYALGREELQLLSIVEEARALQARLDKSKIGPQSIYNFISSGIALSLHAIQATTGRWAAQEIPEASGVFYVEWALDGDGLYKGDRILEINGHLVTCKTKEEFQKSIGTTGKCQMVVLRKKPAAIPQKQLDQEKENNMRLQHRISYLEEQVKELQSSKQENDKITQQQQQQLTQQQQLQQQLQENQLHGHVTSISISSPPSTPPEKPMVFQRGNYITTLVGGKPIELMGDESSSPESEPKRHQTLTKSKSAAHITKTLIRENSCQDINVMISNNKTSTTPLSSKVLVNGESNGQKSNGREKERQRDKDRERYERVNGKMQLHARSVEQLNHTNGILERRRDTPRATDIHSLRARLPCDMRSVKSLDFDSENEAITASTRQRTRAQASDTMSEARSIRPTPPKKPLRLSLQRAQSLQTVELSANSDLERKRPTKRAHITNSTSKLSNGELQHHQQQQQHQSQHHSQQNGHHHAHHHQHQQHLQAMDDDSRPNSVLLIENCVHKPVQHTSSLGRHRHNL